MTGGQWPGRLFSVYQGKVHSDGGNCSTPFRASAHSPQLCINELQSQPLGPSSRQSLLPRGQWINTYGEGAGDALAILEEIVIGADITTLVLRREIQGEQDMGQALGS